MGPPTINALTVRRLARQGRVVAHPTKYHAGRHGMGFVACLTALERCREVAKDPRHAEGWFAIADQPYGRRVRIDFDVHLDDEGTLILVVTAYHT